MSKKSPEQSGVVLPEQLSLRDDFPPPRFEEWRSLAEASLAGESWEEALENTLAGGLKLKPIYCRRDSEDLPHTQNLPGFFPFARGASSGGSLDGGWQIIQGIETGSAAQCNTILKKESSGERPAIHLVMNTDPSDSLTGGISISRLDDMRTVFSGIDLAAVPIYLSAGVSPLPLAMMLVALFRSEGHEVGNLRGGVLTDPLGYLVSTGGIHGGLDFVVDQMAALSVWSKEQGLKAAFKTVDVSGLPYHDGGAHAVQELAFVMATAAEYLDRLLDKKLSVDDIAPLFRFSFGIGPHFFTEVAKIRAARMIWANIVRAYAGDEDSQKMFVHARTSRISRTRCDPHTNMLRATTETLSAILAGVDSLQTDSYDELFRQPDAFSRRIARNTQLILREEAHLGHPIDAAGGSYYVERLTSELAQKAWELFQKIDGMGGMLAALKAGFPQRETVNSAALRQERVSNGKEILVGVNRYANPGEAIRDRQGSRDGARRGGAAEKQSAAENMSQALGKNLSERLKVLQSAWASRRPSFFNEGEAAFLSGASAAEVSKVLQEDGSSPFKAKAISPVRLAEPFERLRLAVETKYPERPGVLLLPLGTVAQSRARADFARGFFEVAGLDVRTVEGMTDPQGLMGAVLRHAPAIVALCSSDQIYAEVGIPLIARIKREAPTCVVVRVGGPGGGRKGFSESGADEFIYEGMDLPQAHASIIEILGRLA